MAKGSQNDAKMDAKIIEKSMRFWNLRFLVFCKEYNLKIVFLHDQGYQKQAKINQNLQKSIVTRFVTRGQGV